VMTEEPNAYVKANWKVCGGSGSSLLPVVHSCVNKVSINPIQNPSY
jgi:hypothetical protein